MKRTVWLVIGSCREMSAIAVQSIPRTATRYAAMRTSLAIN